MAQSSQQISARWLGDRVIVTQVRILSIPQIQWQMQKEDEVVVIFVQQLFEPRLLLASRWQVGIEDLGIEARKAQTAVLPLRIG